MKTRDNLRAKAAIVGFGDAYATYENPKTPLHLAAEAMRKALDDAGLKKEDIDGLLTGREPSADPRPAWNTIFAAYVKLTPTYNTMVNIHAAGMNSMIKHAAMAVTTGVARFVLCVGSDATALFAADPVKLLPTLDTDPEFELPYGPILPSIYAQIARRYMFEYGITEEQISLMAVHAQNWAVHHPFAAKAKKGKITVDTVMNSRMIASPLRLWHCSTYGPPGTGGAFIVAASEVAEKITDKPIYLLGSGEAGSHEYLTDRMALRRANIDLGKLPNLTNTAVKQAAKLAYEMAGMGPKDMDVVQTSGNFAFVPMMVLEDLGFCEKGGAGRFIEEGHTDVGGDLPFNTDGGWLSFGQPGTVCVMDSMIEGIRQVRGLALGKQVEPIPKICLVHSLGGVLANHSVTILSTEK